MLLFIENLNIEKILVRDFNTSHVTVYPISSGLNAAKSTDFNTSHVTVYPNGNILRGAKA